MIRTLAAAALALFAAATPAQAAGPRAYLLRCDATSSPATGKFMYVGTYQYAGQVYVFSFASYCPNSVELY